MEEYNSFSAFLSTVKSVGLAKQNRFYVNMTRPVGLNGFAAEFFNGDRARLVHLLCKGVSVPGVEVSTQPLRLTGESIEIPYDRTYGPATLTFYVDKNMYVRKFFEDWINSVQNPATRVLSYYDEIVSELSVYVDSTDNVPRYKQTLIGAYPKGISPINLSHDDNNLMTVDVTFTYRMYTTELSEGIGYTSNGGYPPSPAGLNSGTQGFGAKYKNVVDVFQSLNRGSDVMSVYNNDLQAFQRTMSSAQGTFIGGAGTTQFTDGILRAGTNDSLLAGGESRSYRR